MIPTFEEIDRHSLTALSTTEVGALDGGNTTVAIVIASIEQHGPHLPLLTDSIIGQTNLNRALGRTPAGLPLFTLPTLCYGKSNEHNSFPGTFALRATTMMDVLRDIGAGIKRAGLHKLVFINGHGGNPQPSSIPPRKARSYASTLPPTRNSTSFSAWRQISCAPSSCRGAITTWPPSPCPPPKMSGFPAYGATLCPATSCSSISTPAYLTRPGTPISPPAS